MLEGIPWPSFSVMRFCVLVRKPFHLDAPEKDISCELANQLITHLNGKKIPANTAVCDCLSFRIQSKLGSHAASSFQRQPVLKTQRLSFTHELIQCSKF